MDEIKRKELERLRHLAIKQNEIQQGIDRKHIKIPEHLEVRSPRFEIDDLKKLIKSTTLDLEEADKQRRDDFKKYEMEKKFEEEERLKHIENEEKDTSASLQTLTTTTATTIQHMVSQNLKKVHTPGW